MSSRTVLFSTLLIILCAAGPARASEFNQYGIEAVGGSLSSLQAGAHAEANTTFELKTDAGGSPFAATRDAAVELPPGLLGNVGAFPVCTASQFEQEGCPIDTQVGIVNVSAYLLGTFTEPLFNLSPGSDSVARLGFYAQFLPNVINVRVRSESDYGVTASSEGILSVNPLIAASVTVWAVPADPIHDPQRITVKEAGNGEGPAGGGRASGLNPEPLMRNPTSCGSPLSLRFETASYPAPDDPASAEAALGTISGCGKLGFAPTLSLLPTSHEANAPSGAEIHFQLPQNEAVNGLATSDIREASVVLPAGMTLAPGAAAGLEACSAEEAGYRSRRAAACPDASKLGSAEIDVAALSRPLHGALYLRTPAPGNLFRVWLAADDLGLHMALPLELNVDQATGQISATFTDLPQAPVRDAKISLFGGAHAALATPATCGSYATRYSIGPWSGTPSVEGTASMKIDGGCEGGRFDPKLVAGSVDSAAGSYSPFVFELTRRSNEQNVAGLDVAMPPGVLAKLAGVTVCPDAATDTGACPATSQIGTVTLALGPGSSPLWIPQPGKAPTATYLGGPYKGAPYSLIVVTRAQAGPFDLGTIVTRAAIHVDPETARVTIKSDPLPQFLEGVPISYRTVHVDIDRPRFTINPTNCAEESTRATVTSNMGAVASPTSRFQVSGCRESGFKPRLVLKLNGGHRRGDNPALRAVLRPRPGDANSSRISVALPHSEFLDQAHIRTVCTRVQFAADAGNGARCPAGSVYGHVRAWTPLLSDPLEGPIFLRSSNHPLPDLVLALHGQIEINVAGRIDSVNGGIRSTFDFLPDAPISKVVVNLQGGRRGLLQNSRNTCANEHRATVKLLGYNGKRHGIRPRIRAKCRGHRR